MKSNMETNGEDKQINTLMSTESGTTQSFEDEMQKEDGMPGSCFI